VPGIRKSLVSITREDILAICAQKWPEDEQLEFKEDLPAKKGKGNDLWYTLPRGIGEYARNKILEEVVALANSYGGDLVIGIAETKQKPSRADSLSALPDCGDLAERIGQQAGACIEPPIPSLQTWGVPTESSGAGVVIVRVSKSRLSPHRLLG